ncbi:hypothetical protein [Glutamicibacter ardleyensis]|uniref:hypothetical protein n=1 Tax=Glutamicibacter ardleyensis TaxID=225894 RepID=UPI003FD0E364
MNTYERKLDRDNKPFYEFAVSTGRSTRELKMSFSHNGNRPIVLVNERNEPQLGWRIDLAGCGQYDFNKLPKTLQPLVSTAVNAILDFELAKLNHRVSAWNSVSLSDFERVRDAVSQVYKVDTAHAVLSRSRSLGFDNPLSDEALNIAHRTLEELVDKDTHEQVVESLKEAQSELDDATSELEELRSATDKSKEPVSDLLDGLDRLKRDLEAGWIRHDVGETLKDKVLERLEELGWKTLSISV